MEEVKFDFDVTSLIDSRNIVPQLSEEQKNYILDELIQGVNADEASRADWEKAVDYWMRLAAQVIETKNTPWANASNVKYPLLTLASTQFAARAYSALLPGTQWVRGKVIGADTTGEKYARASRIGKHMTYQLMDEMEEWETDMDRLLHVLPMAGVCFKKVYFNEQKARNFSALISPKDLIVNYNASSLEDAERKTHLLYLYDNEIEERIRLGMWERPETELIPEPNTKRKTNANETQQLNDAMPGNNSLKEFCECHCYIDLDGDGYKEPYIATFSRNQKVLLRLVANFEEESIVYNPDDPKEIAVITPETYFISYIFMPDPNSGVYGLGFGHLLGPLNEAINTIINQLIDAGTISNLQGGFVSKGFQIAGGQWKFKPGEWKVVNNMTRDMREGIMPLPVREPSGVLFTLLGMLENSGMKVASVVDILTGDIPGQNTKATVAMAAVEQGLKVFTSIHKRLHRSFKKEVKLLFKLNSKFLSPEEYFNVLDDQVLKQNKVSVQDYDLKTLDVIPYSDPNVSSEQMRLAKVQALLDILPLGAVNPTVVTKRYLEATEQPGVEELMKLPPPQPNPEIMMRQAELQHKFAMDVWDRKLASIEVDLKSIRERSTAILTLAKAEELEQGTQFEIYKDAMNQVQQEETRLLDLYKELVNTGPMGPQQEGEEQPAPQE